MAGFQRGNGARQSLEACRTEWKEDDGKAYTGGKKSASNRRKGASGGISEETTEADEEGNTASFCQENLKEVTGTENQAETFKVCRSH